MYLPPASVRDLFRQGLKTCGPGSRFVFSYLDSLPDGRPDAGRWTGVFLAILKFSGEPWLWSTRPGELETFLEATGWTCRAGAVNERHGIEYFDVATKLP